MSDVRSHLWLIPALPLAASVLTAFLGPRLLRRQSHWPCILATIASCALSVLMLLHVHDAPSDFQPYYTWFQAGDVNVGFTLRLDALTAVMLVMVTFVGSWIAIYSVGYMHGDEGYARFFAEIALFIFSMTGLVLADNFLLLYAFWEGVGLCSYLLIGFWFAKPSAAAAARKAFLVTRIGDLGFILGIFLLWATYGYHLDFNSVFHRVHLDMGLNPGATQGVLTGVCLLLFCGAIGKSAQFPLHVWLPDAMEGPSPVSALIHAATMVTAGVYLVARCMPMFQEVPNALVVVACVGAFTALLAALIAVTQNDLKRVLAYSTISQLGYMFLALGSGISKDLVSVAAGAAIFHLITHAFFKALLFLSAGSVMHSMGNVIDMRRFGGLWRILPITHWTFLCGALALAGFPLLSGFWSKDEIFAAAWGVLEREDVRPYHGLYFVLFLSAVFTAGLTAFYTFRAYFMTFWGATRIPHEAGEHAHESPPVMWIPLVVLAIGAVGLGFVLGPLTHWLEHTLAHDWIGKTFPGLVQEGVEPPRLVQWGLIAFSSAVVLFGMFAAWWIYVRKPGLAGRLAGRFQGLYQLSLNKFHFDELYNYFILQPLRGLSVFCRIFDLQVVDSMVDLVGQVPRLIGKLFRPVQNGLVQFYALAMVLGLTVFLIALVRALAG